MSEGVSRADREARRALLHDAIKRVAETDDPDRAAYEAMRALDAYLDAHRYEPATPREPPVMDAAATPDRLSARWILGAILVGAVIATIAVTVSMSGGWPAGIAVAAIWLTTLILLVSAG